jgi:hypothetical protein
MPPFIYKAFYYVYKFTGKLSRIKRLDMNINSKLILLFLILYSSSFFAQLHHQTFGALGSSQTKSNYYISHSVGQSSVIGTSQLNSTTVSQGYQQAIFSEYIVESSSNFPEVKLYPNPFSTQINFDLPQDYDNIQIRIINMNGRIVLRKTFNSDNKSILLNPPFLSDSGYIITLTAHNFYYKTKIIKKH